MATDTVQDVTFIVPGRLAASGTRGGADAGPAPVPPAGLRGRVKTSVQVGERRAGGESVRLTARIGSDVVVLHLAGGPPLILHPETARDLLLGQEDPAALAPRGAARGAVDGQAPPPATPGNPPAEVLVPAELRWRGLEQAAPTRGGGFLGSVLLQGIDIITDLLAPSASKLTAKALAALIDGGVNPGVYKLSAAGLQPLKGTKAPGPVDKPVGDRPVLVLLHGTFVDTASTFVKLWEQHPDRVRDLFRHYADQVYALDHPTLGESPVANALTLVRALPKGVPVRLHLVSHSRGGLVGEVLARAASGLPLATDIPALADAKYDALRAEMKALQNELALRKVTVERLVRVACPARGTLLASRRLDAYLSVLRWALQLSGVPIAPQLVDFLSSVAQERFDPKVLPGLEAMTPDSPLVQWLNQDGVSIPGDLRVVAGDLEGDSIGSWLKTAAADAFYWTDNDIVVQTRSMYGGVPRDKGATFLLDQGGKTTHFAYFVNPRTANAVVDALTQDQPAGFETIGPLSLAGVSATGVRGGTRDDGRPAQEKPAVFVLPGILGSNIRVGDKRIWLGPRVLGGLQRLSYEPGQSDIGEDGPVDRVYGDLVEYLKETHEVIPFGFDWRRPIEEEARRLGQRVAQALDARAKSGQPVRLLAHSMGGLVARTMALECPDIWKRFISRDGGRLLMLGTPNGGSWAPMQVLSGDDTFGNWLVALGAPFQDKAARQLMAEFPGFIQLQAGLLDETLGLSRQQRWKELASKDLSRVQAASWWHRLWHKDTGQSDPQLDAYEWGTPPDGVLKQAVDLRRRLDKQRDDEMKAWADRVLLVVGQARFTPDGYGWTQDGFTYMDAENGGDGRVTLASALLPGVRTWRLDTEHGSLPSERAAFPAFLELLSGGRTDALPIVAGPAAAASAAAGQRGAAPAGATVETPAHQPSRPSRGRLPSRPPVDAGSAFARGRDRPDDAGDGQVDPPLRVTVVNGNLSFVRQPLMVGHYTSYQLTGTEEAVNEMVGGALNESLIVGRYPQDLRDVQIFLNTAAPRNGALTPRPAGVVVVGLGQEGALTEAALAAAVCQGVLAWAGRLSEGDRASPPGFELAATLMGSGGIGFQPGNSARAIAQGVRDANKRIAKLNERLTRGLWPRVVHLVLVELYLERAADAWHGLQVQAVARPGQLDVTPTVQSGTGPLRRPISTAYRGATYDYISVTSVSCWDGQPVSGTAAASTVSAGGPLPEDRSNTAIQFRLDTRRARTEVRATRAQSRLLEEMICKASNDHGFDAQIGRTLFQLLVPPEIEPFLGGRTHMLLEVDDGTSPLPWEMLDTQPDDPSGEDHVPWSVRTRLIRKLSTSVFRDAVRDASADNDVLIVGEPACDPKLFGPLPGALAEAKAVSSLMKGGNGVGPGRTVELLGGADATSVINALMSRPYRIVHIAGHGMPGGMGGVVLSGGTFLGPREIGQMRTVPELVFVNCCHLAARGIGSLLKTPDPFNRSEFAAATADALVRLGVRCVIAAGWAVDDAPAETFARIFYRALLAGRSFIEAIGEARERTWREHPRSNTWAAYQCYGDPEWRFVTAVGDANTGSTRTPVTDVQAEYADVASPLGLTMSLEKIATDCRFAAVDKELQAERVRYLEARFGDLWGRMGAVAEAFGVAWVAVRGVDKAIEWYERAVSANDGSASLRAGEQLANERARRAWKRVDGQAKKADFARRLKEARDDIEAALTHFNALIALRPTVERLALRGSAYKRLAMIEREAAGGDSAAERDALKGMAAAYIASEELALEQHDARQFYPTLNRLAADLVSGRPGPLDTEVLARARAALDALLTDDADFWVIVSRIELSVYEALAEFKLADVLSDLLPLYEDLHGRVPASELWGSVADQAAFVLARCARGAKVEPAEAKAWAKLLAVLKEYAKG